MPVGASIKFGFSVPRSCVIICKPSLYFAKYIIAPISNFKPLILPVLWPKMGRFNPKNPRFLRFWEEPLRPHRRPCPYTNASIRNSRSKTANATTHARIRRWERGFALRDWPRRLIGKAYANRDPSYRESRSGGAFQVIQSFQAGSIF
jgi:hypothetical protein